MSHRSFHGPLMSVSLSLSSHSFNSFVCFVASFLFLSLVPRVGTKTPDATEKLQHVVANGPPLACPLVDPIRDGATGHCALGVDFIMAVLYELLFLPAITGVSLFACLLFPSSLPTLCMTI